MSHKGKHYPRHFRRDCAINMQPPWDSFPILWRPIPVGCRGTGPTYLFGHTVFLWPIDEKIRPLPRWELNPTNSPGSPVQISFELPNLSYDTLNNIVIQVRDLSNGLLASGTMFPDRVNQWPLVNGDLVNGPVHNPDLWRILPGSYSIQMRAITWQEYNLL